MKTQKVKKSKKPKDEKPINPNEIPRGQVRITAGPFIIDMDD